MTTGQASGHELPRSIDAMARAQGAYYLVTGLWPLVHYSSFVAASGPKLEPWLVRTVGMLLTAIGGSLLVGARRRERGSTLALGATAAAAMALVSGYYAARRRIAPAYFLDAGAEVAILAGWALASRPACKAEA